MFLENRQNRQNRHCMKIISGEDASAIMVPAKRETSRSHDILLSRAYRAYSAYFHNHA